MSESFRKPPHAEISGAGFAGLTAAVAFRQRGWTVRIHERGPELRQFGAGIVIWENGLAVLKAIGAHKDVVEKSFVPPFYETRVHNQTMSKEKFDGIDWRTMTRSSLYGAILAAAEREGVEIEVNSEVIAADPSGFMTLSNGRTLKADLVVGADGVGSKVRDSVGFIQERRKSRDGISRFLVPRMKDELGDGEWDNVIDFWNFDPQVLRVLYVPCNNEDLYIALMAPRDDSEGSRVPIDLNLWSSTFPQLTPVLKAASTLSGKYDRYETTVLENWSKGRVALIGDAAHAMCPALAQGAGCAMTNAYTLAASIKSVENLENELKAWESRERGITDRCQRRSAYFADTRDMSNGNQFTPTMLETALYDPTLRYDE